MAKKILWSGSTTLPAPTSLSVNDEIIWTCMWLLVVVGAVIDPGTDTAPAGIWIYWPAETDCCRSTIHICDQGMCRVCRVLGNPGEP